MRIVTAAEMKQIEKNANDAGLNYYDMMENAGRGAAEYIKSNTKDFETKLCLICVGNGNNGGDGYVAARILKELGGSPIIMMACGEPKTPDSIKTFEIAKNMGIEIIAFEPDAAQKSMAVIFGCEVIVDCIYGTGFHGELRENVKPLFDIINDSDAVKFAVDIPSGVSDSGAPAEGAIKADHTIAIDSLKHAHINALDHCGKITTIDIGIPEECHNV